jgi:hypothetical protein
MQVNGVFRLAKEAPEAAAGRSRGIFATRKKVRGVSAMYGDHFPATRVSTRTRLRGRACLCTCVFSKPEHNGVERARRSVYFAQRRRRVGRQGASELSGMVRVSDVPHWTKSTGTIPP